MFLKPYWISSLIIIWNWSLWYLRIQNWTMNKYLELGAPPEKLVMGIHGAGSSFTLANNSNHGIGDVVSGGGEKGPLLKFAGRLAYPEVKTNSIILNLIKLDGTILSKIILKVECPCDKRDNLCRKYSHFFPVYSQLLKHVATRRRCWDSICVGSDIYLIDSFHIH